MADAKRGGGRIVSRSNIIPLRVGAPGVHQKDRGGLMMRFIDWSGVTEQPRKATKEWSAYHTPLPYPVTDLEDVLVGGAVVEVAADCGNGVVEGDGILDLKALRGGHHVPELARYNVDDRARGTEKREQPLAITSSEWYSTRTDENDKSECCGNQSQQRTSQVLYRGKARLTRLGRPCPRLRRKRSPSPASSCPSSHDTTRHDVREAKGDKKRETRYILWPVRHQALPCKGKPENGQRAMGSTLLLYFVYISTYFTACMTSQHDGRQSL